MANDKLRWILAPTEIAYYFICYIGIALIWQLYEWTRYGEVAPNWFDSLIACLFAYVIVLLYKLNKDLKVNTVTLKEYRDVFRQTKTIIESRNELIAEQNELLIKAAEELERLKRINQPDLLYALERYVEPEFYCILNDREVFEVHGPEDIRPVGSLAREKLSSVSKT